MPKFYIPLAVLVIIFLGGISGYLIFQKFSSFNSSQILPEVSIDINKCDDGICGPVEKKNRLCPQDCQISDATPIVSSTATPKPTTVTSQQSFGDNSIDADGIIWGTEVLGKYIENVKNVVNNTLKTKYVKIRSTDIIHTKDGKTFTPDGCLLSLSNCVEKVYLDSVVKSFKDNNWSMIPMLSHDSGDTNITSSDIDNYVNFVDWFVSRYKMDANIKYVELYNAPFMDWKGTKEQLLELNNKTYERIKSKFPDIIMGTPGFEYMFDNSSSANEIQQIEYFLDKANGAKFDFWAFHGYPLTAIGFKGIAPPTKTATNNKYGGISGILEIRKKLDANGWQSRLIIDTEHIGIAANQSFSSRVDNLDAAYMPQQLLLKRTLKNGGKFILSGIVNLKIYPRGSIGEIAWGSLNSDNSLTKTVKSVSILLSKLNQYNYSSHISGEFDNENQAWIEKFTQDANKELYIFFKPFKYKSGQSISLDNEILNYTLNLTKTPSKITLTDIDGKISNPSSSNAIILKAVNAPQYLEVEY